jgi:hypothetical protein
MEKACLVSELPVSRAKSPASEPSLRTAPSSLWLVEGCWDRGSTWGRGGKEGAASLGNRPKS